MKIARITSSSSVVFMFIIAAAFQVCFSDAYNVLMLPLAVKSHVISLAAIAEGLANRGHKVTLYIGSNFLLNFTNRTEVSTVRYKDTTGGAYVNFDAIDENINKAMIECDDNKRQHFAAATIHSRTWCEHITVENEDNLRQLEQEKFDVAVVDNIYFARCKYLVAHRLQIPWISYTEAVDPLTVRVPWLPSFVPSHLFPATERMNFIDRLQNAVAWFALYFVAPQQYPEPPQGVLDAFRRYGHFDSLNDLVLKSVFWFLPKDTVLDSPRPMMPNMANIGGLTLKRSTEKLPAEIRNFIARAKKGIILMTFGTMASTMPTEMVEKFCSAFRRLQDYGVIWRLNSSDEVILPDNVMVAQWLPQQDILAHKSVRLFITHSGNNGQYEAIYHAVPMIGFPILGDQFYNARRLDYKGYGISMDLCDFTADQLLGNIHKILGNSSYKERVTKASEIFRSQAQSPVEKATFWIEHVCRFGGDHLRSAGNDLPLYSYFMLDVLLFILAILLIVIYLMFMLIGFVLQKCRKQRIVEIAKSKKDK